jgi:hypothetical protein
MLIDRATYDSFDGTLEQRVADFIAALAAHSSTVDQPAPTEHPLVEALARAGGMEAAEIAPPVPEPPPPGPIRRIRAAAFQDRLSEPRQQELVVAAVQAAFAGNGLPLAALFNQAASAMTDLDAPRTVDGVAALRTAGLVTEAEAEALLADGTSAET